MSNELSVYKSNYDRTNPLHDVILDCPDDLLDLWKNAGVLGDVLKEVEDLICPIDSMTDAEFTVMEHKVLDVYKDCAEHFHLDDNEFVPFSFVVEQVRSRNTEVCEQVGNYEYMYGPQNYYREFLEANDLDPDDPDVDASDYFDEVPSHLCEEWEDLLYTYYFKGKHVDEYVQYVLDKYRMQYSFEKNDIAYDRTNATALIFRINKEATFMANDAQNVVLPEFISFGFAGYNDYVNFHEEFDLSDRLLGGGAL